MALRNQIAETRSTFVDPTHGINLWSAPEDLKPGEAALMQNFVFKGGTRIRTGSQGVTGVLASNISIRGGHKFYYGGNNPQKKRLIAYSGNIAEISDGGVENIIYGSMVSDQDTHFVTWSITDKVYIGNGIDTLRHYDGTTFDMQVGTNIPVPRWIAPIGDRLMAITVNGIERCNPRNPSAWSENSSWATLRPSRVGLFTCIHPISLRGTDAIYPGLLAFQPNSYYLVGGTDFGADVTSVTATATEDSKIELLDPGVGTSSPYSVCSVPGIGTFWFTTDLNVYMIPEGSLKGSYVGDKLRSNVATLGLESTATTFINQVWMTYFDRYLMIGIPTGVQSWPVIQFWADLQSSTPENPVWYGPMTGQSIRRVWVENQQSDFSVMGGEGNPSVGAVVYRLRVPSYYQDKVGIANNPIIGVYQPYFNGFGAPSKQKYVRSIHYDLVYNPSVGTALATVIDLNGSVLSGPLTLDAVT